jgi:hypothetical protein
MYTSVLVLISMQLSGVGLKAQAQNLLKNPGFEETGPGLTPGGWTNCNDSVGQVVVSEKEAHGGKNSLAIPAETALEQKISHAEAGAYLARCWVKSESEQAVTFLLQDPDQPWMAYNCAEIKVPAGRWVKIESFCALDRNGSLSLTLGGMSKEFRLYHGAGAEMKSAIIADDFELSRYEPKPAVELAVWDPGEELKQDLEWSGKEKWTRIKDSSHTFSGAPVVQARHLVGTVRKSDGALTIYSIQDGKLEQRCVLVPKPNLIGSQLSLVREEGRVGIRASSGTGDRSCIFWFSDKGLIRVETHQIPEFQIQECRLRYGLLPSFAGTDICYDPVSLGKQNACAIPSTQWFVGLREGNESMLVAVWEKDSQKVSLGLAGEGEKRLIDSLSIGTGESTFALSFVEHANIWHREALKEDWLGEYQTIQWARPFQARWMEYLHVTTGGEPSFRDPGIGYAFPSANAKTRMWGVWFEDWNHYPFFFDGTRTILHFEKTFVPQGDALFYFLEPAAADFYSPLEIVEQALGAEPAASLLSLDANRLRKLTYSTPDKFMFDRPVCATTTRLSKIKQEDKATVGVNLAMHLYEFIREIRARVDQYEAFFSQVKNYLESAAREHPEVAQYTAELEKTITDAQARSEEIYAVPLSAVQKKTDEMKAQLLEGKGDGYECGKLDVRGPAGDQDDLCRRYNRVVISLMETAALKCGDSAEKAVVAKYIWNQSRAVLSRPTRWESRRTLYFFEP